jgi:outer membrane protein assembly factor BamB
VLWKATVGNSIASQPVVAAGRVYVTTKSGVLYCLETGDRNDDGWLMWGADARHSGQADETESKQARGDGAPQMVHAVLRD